MLSILHGSDLHFGKPYDDRAGEAFLEAAHEASPDLIVLSGDFTQRAKVREYRRASEYLELLPDVPTVVTPGNHDVPLYRIFERLFHPLRNYREWISDELNSVTRVKNAVVVSLDSTAPHRAIVNGRLGMDQLDFAARAFGEAPGDATRILVMHHHLAPARDFESDRPLPGSGDILDALEGMKVELILSGHLHRAFIGNSLDIYAGADPDHGIVIVHSGTTTSRRGRARERAKNSFNLVRISDDFLEITHQMYFDDAEGFAPFSVHAFPRRSDGYFSRDPFSGEEADMGFLGGRER